MSDLTIFPADLAAMSTAQLVALPITDFVAAERNVDEATAYLKQLRVKPPRAGGATRLTSPGYWRWSRRRTPLKAKPTPTKSAVGTRVTTKPRPLRR